MIAYSIPQLTCECGYVLAKHEQQPKVGGRVILYCGNRDCRHRFVQVAFKPVEHVLERA